MSSFAEKLKEQMWKARKTGLQLAQEVSVDPVTISRYRTGKRYPNVLIIMRIKNALGCELTDLL